MRLSLVRYSLIRFKFSPDSKGNFEIGTENEEIVVKHFNPAGDELLQIFRGKDAERLGKQIAPFISEIGNDLYLYIGRELQKAETKIKTPEDR